MMYSIACVCVWMQCLPGVGVLEGVHFTLIVVTLIHLLEHNGSYGKKGKKTKESFNFFFFFLNILLVIIQSCQRQKCQND